jgi:hypothetical protein
MNSSSYEAFEAFEADDAQPVVKSFHLTRIWKTGHCVDRDEFGFINIDIGNGCQITASLLRDGSLKLPADVRIPADLRRRAKQEAQRLAIEELAEEWREQRDVGEVFDGGH